MFDSCAYPSLHFLRQESSIGNPLDGGRDGLSTEKLAVRDPAVAQFSFNLDNTKIKNGKIKITPNYYFYFKVHLNFMIAKNLT